MDREKIAKGVKEGVEKVFDFSILVDVDFNDDAYLEKCLITVMGKLIVQKIARHEFKRPRDWAQAFKERWFPAYLLKRWPVLYITEVVEVGLHYPDIAIPDERYNVIKWQGWDT